jgi:hypothetical protein
MLPTPWRNPFYNADIDLAHCEGVGDIFTCAQPGKRATPPRARHYYNWQYGHKKSRFLFKHAYPSILLFDEVFSFSSSFAKISGKNASIARAMKIVAVMIFPLTVLMKTATNPNYGILSTGFPTRFLK